MTNFKEQLGRSVEVLLVEDNPGDVSLILEGLKDAKLKCHIHVVEDGIAALEFLRRQGPYSQKPLIDVVLLDLNLPKKDGREVLAEIKADPALLHIPVVILTSSQAEQDVITAYNLHANCYIRKPVDFDQFVHAVRMIDEFWLELVILPKIK